MTTKKFNKIIEATKVETRKEDAKLVHDTLFENARLRVAYTELLNKLKRLK